jgi:hypothetical protein
MHNKFPGVCYLCSLYVAAGEGRIERKLGGWRVRHAPEHNPKGKTCAQAQQEAQARGVWVDMLNRSRDEARDDHLWK